MDDRTRLVVDVRELLAAHGVRKRLGFEEAVDGLEFDLAQVTSDLLFDLTLEAIEGDQVVVRGRVSGVYRETCRRCLTETDRDFSLEVAEIFRPAADVWEEGYVIADERIDLRPMVRDNVVLHLPVNPICDEACKGFCTRCGTNLNEAACSCEDDRVDHRWDALRDLLGGS